jgi:sugar O-acyltransferase (sialic acid O-acetyltransferase NeuD family)
MSPWTTYPWQHNLKQSASGNPGAVQTSKGTCTLMGNLGIQDFKKKTQIVLVGCGGFAQEIATYIVNIAAQVNSSDCELTVSDVVDSGTGRFDDIDRITESHPLRHQDYSQIDNIQDKKFVLCLGDPVIRHREFQKIHAFGGTFFTVIHPLAFVSATASIGDGCILAPFVFVGPFASVGANCAINVRATIGHDAHLGESVVVSPHVDINGAVVCGDCTFFGSGVIVQPSLVIGKYAKIAAASVVKQAIGDGELGAGNPAKGRKFYAVPT